MRVKATVLLVVVLAMSIIVRADSETTFGEWKQAGGSWSNKGK